jgi:hypothetical protein
MILLGGSSAIAAPSTTNPEPASELWLTYDGGDGPGAGKHIVLIAAEQEYRSEQSMPMLARILSHRYGFKCTVLFLVNDEGLVDVTGESPIKEANVFNRVPGLEQLDQADGLIWMSRFLKLSDKDAQHLYDYFDAGKPIIALRTANHGLHGCKPYLKDGTRVSLEEMLGGAFKNHHGGWKHEATSGIIVEHNKAHPVLIGVHDVWGTSDTYRCQKDDTVPADCTPLLLGQPMKSHDRNAPPNTEKQPLPIAWTKTWVGNKGLDSRILHFTMGSAEDFANEGVRRVVINGVFWGLGMEDQIKPDMSVDIVGEFVPMEDGFNYKAIGVKPRPASDFR